MTENAGDAVIDNGQTSSTVAHGLAFVPQPRQISITPTNTLGQATKFYVDPATITATTFTIRVDRDPGPQKATFDWRASWS